MRTVRKRRLKFRTVAELQEYLWGIPLYRIRLDAPPGEVTDADVLVIHSREKRTCELIDGILVEKDGTFFESLLTYKLGFWIERYREVQDFGVAMADGGFLRIAPGQIRAADLSFLSWDRMPNGQFPKEEIWSVAPDLAVEILCDGNTEGEMDRKLRDYFEARTRMVWVVEPKGKTVRVFTSPRKSVLLTKDDTLNGRKVIPGFSLSIREWFNSASRDFNKFKRRFPGVTR
jgi:Uma2 family endonuclease